MKINTKYHGVKEYEECDVINFEKSLPGFIDLKRFILFPIEENEVFSVLHSIDNADIGLVVASPFYVDKQYEFKLEDDKLDELKIENESDVLVLNTICLNRDMKKMTMNLKAPIVINIKEKKGEQLILDNDKYLVKHPLFKEE